MRKIKKGKTPKCLKIFIAAQLAIEPEPVNLTYDDFRDKGNLLAILVQEQLGLCGYTGAPVDDQRVAKLTTQNGKPHFKSHIEHLKCQEKCKEDLAAQGKEYGRDLGEDLDYKNMVAALEVRGAEVEHFGAVAKGNKDLPVYPTHCNCNARFIFNEADGSVTGVDADAKISIDVLRLNHDTLKIWRKSAIDVWLDFEKMPTRKELRAILKAVEKPIKGQLPEYAFVVSSIIRGYLGFNS